MKCDYQVTDEKFFVLLKEEHSNLYTGVLPLF